MSRLLEPPANYPQWPVHYLLGCYERASQQLRQAGQLKDKIFSARLQQALAEIKDLAVRYASLLLTMDGSMFEQVCCFSMPCTCCRVHAAWPCDASSIWRPASLRIAESLHP